MKVFAMPSSEESVFTGIGLARSFIHSCVAFIACLTPLTARSQPADEPIHLGDIELVIHQEMKPGDLVGGVELAVGKLAESIFDDAPLSWDPTEFLAETKLVCEQDKSVALKLGVDELADFRLKFTRDRIKKGQKARLELFATRPEALAPGLYRGDLKLRFSSSELDADLFGRIRITVAIQGRRVVEFRFLHEQNGRIRFGMPADLQATIDTIDCELGKGTYQVSFQPSISAAPQSLSPLEVPFEPNEFQDPKLVLKASTYPRSWNDTAFWTDSLPFEEKPTGLSKIRCQWNRHTVTLHLGDCDDLGKVLGALEWPQADVAPGLATSLKKTVEADVIEGLWIRPRIAFTDEPIVLTLASATDLGKSVPALLMDEQQRPQQVMLNLFVPRTTADPRAPLPPRAAGEPYLYQVRLVENRLSTFAVRFPEDAVTTYPLLKELHEGDYQIAVWIKKQEPIRRPLRIFASYEPFWWDWLSDPYKGSAWKESRSPLWQIEFDKDRLKDVSLTLTPLAARPRFLQGTADPDREPVLAVTGPSGDPLVIPVPAVAADPQVAKTPDASGEANVMPTKEVATQSQVDWLSLTSPTVLKGEVRFANQEVIRRRPLIGTFVFPVRMNLRGKSNGVSVVRIFESAVPVEVTTSMVYYRQIIGYVAAGVGLLIIMFGSYRWLNPRTTHGKPRASEPIRVDAMDDYGRPSAKSAVADSEPEGATHPRELQSPVRQPDKKDDIDNW